MTIYLLALLMGLFGVPALLMTLGHRLRGRSEPHKRRFWGGVSGYIMGMVVAVCAMLLPPVWWGDGTFLRPFLVHWAMFTGGVLGVLSGPLWARTPAKGKHPPA